MGTGKSYEVQKKKKIELNLCCFFFTESLHDSNFKYVAE